LFFSLVLIKKTTERRSDETEGRKQMISSDFRLGKVRKQLLGEWRLDAAMKVSFMGRNLVGLKLMGLMISREAFYDDISVIRGSGELAEAASDVICIRKLTVRMAAWTLAILNEVSWFLAVSPRWCLETEHTRFRPCTFNLRNAIVLSYHFTTNIRDN
jgi:hypothetical protein